MNTCRNLVSLTNKDGQRECLKSTWLRSRLGLLTCLLVIFLAVGVQAQNWSQYRGTLGGRKVEAIIEFKPDKSVKGRLFKIEEYLLDAADPFPSYSLSGNNAVDGQLSLTLTRAGLPVANVTLVKQASGGEIVWKGMAGTETLQLSRTKWKSQFAEYTGPNSVHSRLLDETAREKMLRAPEFVAAFQRVKEAKAAGKPLAFSEGVPSLSDYVVSLAMPAPSFEIWEDGFNIVEVGIYCAVRVTAMKELGDRVTAEMEVLSSEEKPRLVRAKLEWTWDTSIFGPPPFYKGSEFGVAVDQSNRVASASGQLVLTRLRQAGGRVEVVGVPGPFWTDRGPVSASLLAKRPTVMIRPRYCAEPSEGPLDWYWYPGVGLVVTSIAAGDGAVAMEAISPNSGNTVKTQAAEKPGPWISPWFERQDGDLVGPVIPLPYYTHPAG